MADEPKGAGPGPAQEATLLAGSPPEPRRVHLQAGTILAGRFEIDRDLGAGGAGEVYAARDRLIGEEVALKVLHPHVRKGGLQLERLRAEVRAARRIAHPNVCRVHDLCEAGGVVFVVMELLTGDTLRHHIADGLDLGTALHAARQLGAGLSAAHRAGVIHCDVKPENAIVCADRIVLTDFGVARLKGADRPRARGGEGPLDTASIEGTPAYMAPEQVLGEAVDERTDVYALAAVLFELVYGAPPFGFPRVDQPIMAILDRILHEAPAVPEEAPEGLTRGARRALASALVRGLAKSPDERTESVEALVTAVMAAARMGGSTLHFPAAPTVAGPTPPLPTLASHTYMSTSTGGTRRAWLDGGPTASGASRGPSAARRPRVELARSPVTRRIATIVHVRVDEDLEGGDDEAVADQAEAVMGAAEMTLDDAGGLIVGRSPRQIVAVFGALSSRGNEPQRAAEAGRAIVAAGATADGVAVRVGVDAGRLLVRRGKRGAPPTVSGDALAEAERLAREASPGQVVVSARTARHIASRFRTEPTGRAGAVRIVGTRSAAEVAAAAIRPLVGRDAEMETLCGALAPAQRGTPTAALVLGPPGIGKSRLRREVTDALQPRCGFALATAAAEPSDAFASYAVLRHLMRRLLGLGQRVTHEEAENAAARVLQIRSGDSDDVLVAALAALLEGGVVESGVPVGAAVKRALAASARRQPLLIVVDDAHWADDATLDIIESLARGEVEAPLAVYVSARPELRHRRPHLIGAVRTQLELGALEAEAAAELARQWLGDADEEARTRLAEASDGNPYFLEELAREYVDRGGGVEFVPPATVEEAIQARLDRLSVLERETLRAAAVLGRIFSAGELLALFRAARPDTLEAAHLDEALSALEARRTVFPLPADGSSDDRYIIKHALVRDVAYGELPPGLRRKLHTAAADLVRDRLASRGEPSVEELVELARHLEGAEDAPAAAEAYHRAGLHAAAQAALRECFRCQSRAHALFGDSAPLSVIFSLAESGIEIGEFESVDAVLAPALTRARETGSAADAARVLYLMSGSAKKRARWNESVEHARAGLALIDDEDDVILAARLHGGLGWVLGYMIGDLENGLAEGLRAVELLEGVDRGELAVALAGLGASYMRAGRWRDQLACNLRNLELGRELGSMILTARAHLNLGVNYHCLGELDESHRHSSEALRLYERMCATATLALVRNNLALPLVDRGDFEAAERELDEAFRLSDLCGGLYFLVEAYGSRARIAAMRGRFDEAEANARKALERALGDGGAVDQGLARKVLGAVLSRAGRHDDALDELARAVELLRDTDIGEHARARAERAKALLRAGRTGEGETLKAQARADLERLGASLDLARLDDLRWV